ncbi:MAG: hypothetical protein ACFFDK_09665, partial [Promethearchaeota archaeon]
IDNDGHIRAIYLWDESIFIGIFPEQICDLEYLEELYLVEHNLKYIPPSISKLKNLKILDISCNPMIHIPKTAKSFLKSLDKFKYDINISLKKS